MALGHVESFGLVRKLIFNLSTDLCFFPGCECDKDVVFPDEGFAGEELPVSGMDINGMSVCAGRLKVEAGLTDNELTGICTTEVGLSIISSLFLFVIL